MQVPNRLANLVHAFVGQVVLLQNDFPEFGGLHDGRNETLEVLVQKGLAGQVQLGQLVLAQVLDDRHQETLRVDLLVRFVTLPHSLLFFSGWRSDFLHLC